jgi:hypothetical protein
VEPLFDEEERGTYDKWLQRGQSLFEAKQWGEALRDVPRLMDVHPATPLHPVRERIAHCSRTSRAASAYEVPSRTARKARARATGAAGAPWLCTNRSRALRPKLVNGRSGSFLTELRPALQALGQPAVEIELARPAIHLVSINVLPARVLLELFWTSPKRTSSQAAGSPTRQGRGQRRRANGNAKLDIAITSVAPGKRPGLERKGLYDCMATGPGMRRVVTGLRLTTADVTALGA